MNDQEQLFSELQDELRRDNLKKLWEQYGPMVIGACVAVVLGTGIGVAWKNYQQGRNEVYTGQLMQALKETGAKKTQGLEAVVKAAGTRPQAALAELYLGAADVDANKGKEALLHYEIASLSGDPGLAALGRVMATHVATSYALELHDQPALKAGAPFYSEWREANGWHLYATGKQAEALADFSAIAGDADAAEGQRERMREVAAFLAPATPVAGGK